MSHMRLAMLVLLIPSISLAQGWEKHISPDGSYSFHYPAGWRVQAQRAMIQVRSAATDEELLILSLNNRGQQTAQQLAGTVLSLLRKKLPDLTASNPQAKGSEAVRMDLSYSQAGKRYAGMLTVLSRGVQAFWFSYATTTGQYAAARAMAILAGVSMSVAAKGLSRPPTVNVPALAGTQRGSAAPRQPEARQGQSGDGDAADIKDAWFRRDGLRGYYGGAMLQEEISSNLRTEGPTSADRSQLDIVTTGGDFRIGFYADGVARVSYLVMSRSGSSTVHVSFKYEGKYALAKSGKLSAPELKLSNSPRTSMQFEKHMTKMRIAGTYAQESDSFRVTVSTYDPAKKRWEVLGKDKTLRRATHRRSSMFGSVRDKGGELRLHKD